MDDVENRQNQADESNQTQSPSETPLASPMFLSSFSHTLDAKSRVVVPAVYREGLGKDFVIAPSEDFGAIALYPLAVWEAQRDKLARKAKKNTSVGAEFLEMFTTYSFRNQECDSQGRCLLPTRMKQFYLQDAKDVVISGRMDFVLVRSQEMAEARDREFMLNRAERLKQLDMIED